MLYLLLVEYCNLTKFLLLTLLFSIGNCRYSFLVLVNYSNGGNTRFSRSSDFLTKINSNGEKPDNTGDAKVFTGYAATDVYNGHISPFPVSCLLSFCLWFVAVFLFLSCHDLMGLLFFYLDVYSSQYELNEFFCRC